MLFQSINENTDSDAIICAYIYKKGKIIQVLNGSKRIFKFI
jgi:hypothetical protein